MNACIKVILGEWAFSVYLERVMYDPVPYGGRSTCLLTLRRFYSATTVKQFLLGYNKRRRQVAVVV